MDRSTYTIQPYSPHTPYITVHHPSGRKILRLARHVEDGELGGERDLLSGQQVVLGGLSAGALLAVRQVGVQLVARRRAAQRLR